MYLLTAVSDELIDSGKSIDSPSFGAIQRLWRNMVDKKMYVTGGIGAIKQYEGFGIDYFLPQGTDGGGCCSETCAAIGVMMLAERLLQVNLNGEYSDIMELCLYNSVLTTMSSDGKAFTYVSQLASSDQDLSKRESWFTCACCPPNIMRLLGQIGGYATTCKTHEDTGAVDINVRLFLYSIVRIPVGSDHAELSVCTNWPWSGEVEFRVSGRLDNVNLKIRIPGWAESHQVRLQVEPACPDVVVTNGYLVVPPQWVEQNPFFVLSIPVEARVVSPHLFTNENTVTLGRGPIVYCVEDIDIPWVSDHFKSVYLDASGKVEEEVSVKDEESGDEYIRLTIKNAARVAGLPKLRPGPSSSTDFMTTRIAAGEAVEALNSVPYYFHANRGGRGHMRVGLRRWERSSREQGCP